MTELEHDKLVTLENRCKSNTHRIDNLESRLESNEKLVTSVALIAQKQDNMESNITEIKDDVKSIKEKPGRRWDSIVEKALLVIVSAVITYFLTGGV